MKKTTIKTNKDMDKFYTNEDIADFVLKETFEYFKTHKINLATWKFLEPCAGGGAFLNALDKNGIESNKIVSYDIAPEDERISKANFLEVKPNKLKKQISIGNPPFGHRGKEAVNFINQSAKWADVIAFILPIQFRRYNVQKTINENLKLVYSSDNLPKNSFNFEGSKYNVNALFQIWVNKDDKRFSNMENIRLLKPLPNKHEDFKLFIYNNTPDALKYFDKNKFQWDFAVTRQGYYDYNQKITDPQKLKKNIQYLFVKYESEISKILFKKIDFEELSKTNTTVPGFSNTDLVAAYNILKEEWSEKNGEC